MAHDDRVFGQVDALGSVLQLSSHGLSVLQPSHYLREQNHRELNDGLTDEVWHDAIPGMAVAFTQTSGV